MVKPRTLGREVPGSSPPVAVRFGLEQVTYYPHSFSGNDQKLIVCVTSKKKTFEHEFFFNTDPSEPGFLASRATEL